MNKLRKSLVVGVMVLTVLATSGVFNISAVKASASAGDLIKMSGNAAVYYLGADGKRYVFPNSTTYNSWYADFSGVVTIPATELQSYLLGGNVVMRPGTKMVKITTDPSVYAVEPNGVLRKIQSEAQAAALYGSNWNKKIVDVADSYFTNYTIGTALANGEVPAGTLVKNAGSAAVYYYDGTNYRSVANEAALSANRFDMANILTLSNTIIATGSAITGAETALVKTSQGATTGTGTIITGSGLMVSLASDTPASQNVPTGVALTMLKVNVTASNDGDINVNGLRLSAGGLGAAADIQSVSVYNNGNKLNSSAKNVSSSDKYAEVNFTAPLVVARGTTATLVVKAKVMSTQNYSLMITKASDVMATAASVTGSFPITGNTMSGTLVTDLGTIDATQDGGTTLADVKLGEIQSNVAKFKLAANKEDITFSSIALKRIDPVTSNSSSISDADLANLKLYKDGSVIATSNGIVNKYVNFVLSSPVVIKDGTTARFEVKADPIDGAGKYARFTLDSETDLVATGNHYGYPVKLTTKSIGADVKVNAGAISLTKVNAVSDKIKKDTKKVEAGSFKIAINSGKNVELSSFNLTVDSTESAANGYVNIENLQLWDRTTGTSYDLSANDVTTASSSKTYKNDSMGLTMHAGETHELVVRFDTIKTAAAVSYTFRVANAQSDLVIKETTNDTRITDITPNSVDLKTVTIQAASAEVTKNALSSTLTATAGSSDVEVYNFNIKAGESSDIKVNTLRFVSSDTTIDNGVVSEFKLWKGTTLLKTVSSSQLSSGEITFDNVNETIAANVTTGYKITVSLVKRTDVSTKNSLAYRLSGYDMEDTDKGNTIYLTGDANTNGIIEASEVAGAGVAANRTVTIVGTAKLHLSIDNTVDATKYDSFVLAGTQTGALASIKMKADDGEAKLTKLRISVVGLTGGNTPSNLFSELALYDGTTKVAATTNLSSNTILFDNVNIVVPTSEKIYTLKGTLNSIGKNQAGNYGQEITFRLRTDSEAQDNASGDSLTAANFNNLIGSTTPSMKIAVVANQISAVSSETSDSSGHSVSTKLTSGDNIVGILKVSVPTSVNTKADGTTAKALINSFNVYATSNATITDMSIEKVGGTGISSATSTVTNNHYLLNVRAGDQEVTPGTTVYYIIHANMGTVPGSNTSSASYQAKLDALNDSTTANISWQDVSDNSTAFTTLRINGLNSLDLPKINN